MEDIVYLIAGDDRIDSVAGGWDSFATANDAPEIVGDAVVGRPWQEFIDGPETRAIYDLIFRDVRARNAATRIPFRCDSPTRRRFLELSIEPLPDQRLRLTGFLVREEVREAVPLFDSRAERLEGCVRVCSWCRRVLVPEQGWREVEDAIGALDLLGHHRPPSVTHGMCEHCEAGWD